MIPSNKTEPVSSVKAEPPGPVGVVRTVVDSLGGGTPIRPSKYCFRMNDGNNILVTASRQYQKTKPFWYGLSPAFFKTAELNACTHVAFGMGTSKIALLPASIIKDYTKHCGVSKYKTDKIHHYHFFITKAEPHEMYGNQDSPRIALGEYIRKR